MDRFLRDLRNCPPAEGAERVYFAGQKEFEAEATSQRLGVPVLAKTYAHISEIGREYDITAPQIVG
jgi:LDH2 family malate/lactate/ureidoglycolate dehydrogenase